MYNSQVPNPMAKLTAARITRIKTQLRALTESTLEAYQAQVYSAVNGVLNIAGQMQPLALIEAETPAIVGDVTTSMLSLTNDAADIVTVVTATESTAAQLFNLAAAAQNQIRQNLREAFYASNASRYLEPFINSQNIASNTGSIDYVVGQATLSEASNTQVLSGTLTMGSGSTAGATATFTPSTATDGTTLTAVAFDGIHLELILSFATPTILNRIKIDLANYAGLELSTLTSSTAGSVFQDVLADLGVTNMVLNGISGKLSGDVVIDFPPRYVSQMRIVFDDRVGTSSIALNSISFWARQFASTSTLTSNLISAPLGNLAFSTDEDDWGAFTTILHQISTDGVNFTAISTGSVISQTTPFYYKASFQVVPSAFSASSTSISQDPAASSVYSLTSTTTVNIGSNILQRTLGFGSIDGPVTLQEVPLPGTFQVSQGAATLNSSTYSFTDGVLSFPAEIFNITVSYQISNVGATAVSDLQPYYTPVLRKVLFQTAS